MLTGPADFSGQDFLQILQLYGARREQLVFESNTSWQTDTMKRGEHLLMTLTELNEELRQLQLAASI